MILYSQKICLSAVSALPSLTLVLLFGCTAVEPISTARSETENGNETRFNIVLKGGRVMDPETGLDAVKNVGIIGSKILRVSDDNLQGEEVIDASDLVVAPGFIDLHFHGTTNDDAYKYRVTDGVTTALEMETGVNPVAPWYAERDGKTIINFGATSGHLDARWNWKADPYRAAHPKATEEEVSKSVIEDNSWAMQEIEGDDLALILKSVEQGIKDGALGVGMGISYTPGATREEIYRVFEIAGRYKVPVFSHPRPTSDVLNTLQEMIANSAATGAPVHLAHLNSTGGEKVELLLEMIEGAQQQGFDITTEAYPYTAGSTFIGAVSFSNITDEQAANMQWSATGEWLTKETVEKYRAENPQGFVIIHFMKAENVDKAIAHPLVMIASDGLPFLSGGEHPRGAGTNARVLGHYVRERGLISLMDALAKMTIMPAQRLEDVSQQMKYKGRLQEGADADITLFNPETVIDRATYDNSTQFSKGIQHVLVNGTFVVKDEQFVEGVFPGVGIRGDRQ